MPYIPAFLCPHLHEGGYDIRPEYHGRASYAGQSNRCWADPGVRECGVDGFENTDLQATETRQSSFTASGHDTVAAEQQGHMTMEAAGWVLG